MTNNLVNILIVDDISDNLLALRSILTHPEYGLVTATSGRDALRYLLDNEFALILLDVAMPGMDGYELAKIIKERERSRHTPIIFLTALKNDIGNVYQGYSTGAVDYLEKPLDPEVVRAKVAVFVELYRHRKELQIKNQKIASQAELLRESERREQEYRIEEIRRASDERYRNLTDAIPQIVWSAQPDGSADYFNKRWWEYTGLKSSKKDGRHWQAALHPSDFERFNELWRNAIETGEPYAEECRLRRKDGTYRWHLCQVMPDRSADGAIASWLGTYTDIDEQKNAEEVRAALLKREQAARWEAEKAQRRALFLSEASIYLASSLDYHTTLSSVAGLAVPDLADWCAVYLIDDDGIPVRVATAHPPTSTQEEGDLLHPLTIAKESALLGTVHTRKSLLVPCIPDEFLRGNAEDPRHLEMLRSANLKSCMLVPLFARQNQMGVMIFSSSQVEYRPEDLLVAEELARRAAQAVDNARLYRESQDAIVFRDEFLSIASHELKTPITALRLQLGHILLVAGRKGATEISEALVRRLKGCEYSVERLTKLIEELLDVTRIKSGRLQLEKDSVNVTALVRDVIASFESELRKTGSQVTMTATPEVQAFVDRFRLEQVVTNLLNNAIKYGAGAPIEVETVANENSIRVRIRDHGIGIAKENQDRVFERFERAVSARDFGGLGLGLFITKQIVEAHGGTIHVDSEIGAGSLFWIEIPISHTVDAAPPQSELVKS